MKNITRRTFLAGSAAAPAFLRAQERPRMDWGVQSGDPQNGRAIVWSRTDRPSRFHLEYAATEEYRNPVRIEGPAALELTDFTARIDLGGLPAGQEIHYRAWFESLEAAGVTSEPVQGVIRTAPAGLQDVRFLWSGDTAGQGYGINPDWGGMRIYEAMRARNPHFFIHSGDTIYADGPIPASIALPDGTEWKNLTTEETGKVAETLNEFRGRYRYNLMDRNVRAFNAAVPQIWQWDDHEVTNNWSPSKVLDERYREKSIRMLEARGRRAFLEYAPMRFHARRPEQIFRRIAYGPLLDVFLIDMRSFRGPNTQNRQSDEGPETAFLGSRQFRWLQRELLASNAVWKVIASDMPIGLQVGDGKDSQGQALWEAVSNGDGPALGRELEIARLLRFLRDSRVRNVIWLTADVHYTAAHYYDPSVAVFQEFEPFWEFVSGPLNAGTFGPAALDNTFGPKVVYHQHPPSGSANLPPSAGLQFFGEVEIGGQTRNLRVTLRDLSGKALFARDLSPAI